MDFRKHFRILRKRKWIILLVFVITVCAYGFYFLQQQPTFTAYSEILLRVPPAWKNMEVLSPPNWETRLATFRSDPFKDKVVARLRDNGIPISVTDINMRASISNEEKSSYIKIYYQDRTLKRAIAVNKALTRTYVEFDRQLSGEAIQTAIRTVRSRLREKRAELRRASNRFQKYKQENQIHSPDQQLARARSELSDIEQQLRNINSQQETVRRKLKKYQEISADQKQSQTSDSPAVQLARSLIQSKTKQLSQAQLRYHQLQQTYGPKHPKISSAQQEIKSLKKQIQEAYNRLPEPDSGSIWEKGDLQKSILNLTLEIEKLKTEKNGLIEQKSQLQQKIARLTDANPEFADLRSEMIQKQEQVRELQNKLERIRSNQSILPQVAEIESIPRLRQGSSQPENKTLYATIVNKLKRFIQLPAVNAENAYAQYPLNQNVPQLAVLAGLFMGISSAYFLEYINNKFDTETDVKEFLDLPILGKIPDLDKESLNLLNIPSRDELSERFQSISGYLDQSFLQDRNSVLVTSTQKGEGKTYTALNIATSLAREGDKVLLIDLDLRSPSLHDILDFSNSTGISTITEGQAELESLVNGGPPKAEKAGEFFNWDSVEPIIQNTSEPNLDVLYCGPLPSHPLKTLKSDELKHLLTLAKSRYDHVFMDSPPLDASSDALVMGARADGVILVIQQGKVSQGEAIHSKKRLEDANASLIGVIMNRTPSYQLNDYSYYSSYEHQEEVPTEL